MARSELLRYLPCWTPSFFVLRRSRFDPLPYAFAVNKSGAQGRQKEKHGSNRANHHAPAR